MSHMEAIIFSHQEGSFMLTHTLVSASLHWFLHLGARPHTIRTVFPPLGPQTKKCLSFSLYKHQNWGLKLMIRSAKGGPTIAGPAGLGSNTCVLYALIITEYHALPLLGNHALVCPWLTNIMTVFIAHECGQHHQLISQLFSAQPVKLSLLHSTRVMFIFHLSGCSWDKWYTRNSR